MESTPTTPLSSLDTGALNIAAMSTPTPTIQRLFHSQPPETSEELADASPIRSVPTDLVPQEADEQTNDQENISPNKARHSRVLSGNGLSPLKILASTGAGKRSPEKSANTKSPKKWCPDKRFPVKVNTPSSPSKTVVHQHEIRLEDALAENKGLEEAVKIFEDEDTMMENSGEGNMSSLLVDDEQDDDESRFQDRSQNLIEVDEEHEGPDDSMISTFSTFSAVPNMTMFDRIGHTPTKFANFGSTSSASLSPVRSRLNLSPEKTPRPHTTLRRESGNTTNLLDFTEQIQGFSSRYSQQVSSLRGTSPGKASSHTVAATPKRKMPTNLLDFDIPPLPTPRSIPSITPRELESLKSGFLSEISSLKASLSGKEAEVSSLKTAVADAEKRVGESLEELREVKAIKEALAEEQDNWEKRGREMESVLRKVREEIVRSQHEREQLESKFEESEKRREAAEIMAQEAESKMAAMRAQDVAPAAAANNNNKSPEKGGGKAAGSREVEIAVEKVSRELHSLYKGKHEAKIAALKKSYENRWSKKVLELESRLDDLVDENEKLKNCGNSGIIAKVDPNNTSVMMDEEEREERKTQAVKDSTQIRELNAEIEKLGAVITSVKKDNEELRTLLEKERVEKGELVLLAEEMMAMQTTAVVGNTKAKSEVDVSSPEPMLPPPCRPVSMPSAKKIQTQHHHHHQVEDFRSSVSRPPTGLRAPASVKKATASRIGGLATGGGGGGSERKAGGLPRPGSVVGGGGGGAGGGRSGIMSSIEKMGNYRGRGE
ncbi:hypothetical protein GGS20DRAFT_557798 [Poronia punctata]|nr:hypothetical protein GGS20DRAFT_557798 [Poronia punctata]